MKIPFFIWSLRGEDFGHFSIQLRHLKPNPAAKRCYSVAHAKQPPVLPWKTPIRFLPIYRAVG